MLTKIADAGDAGKALDAFSPPHAAYKALKAKLAELRGKSGSGGEQIADGPRAQARSESPDGRRARAAAAPAARVDG